MRKETKPVAKKTRPASWKKWRNILASGLMIFTAGALLILLCRAYLRYQIRQETLPSSIKGVDSLEEVEIGGVNQWVLLRGQRRSKPVLLFLHGGPGLPMMPFAHALTELEKYFIVAYWDERGSGKSSGGGIPEDSVTMERLVSDTGEVIRFLRTRFGTPKVYLAGHSWGSVIGMRAAARDPELVYAFLGIGQVADFRGGEKISYEYALEQARKTGNGIASHELEKIGPPPYGDPGKSLTLAKWVEVLGGGFHRCPGALELVEIGFPSPYYSLADFWKFFTGGYFSFRRLWDNIRTTDLFDEIPRIGVPAYFFEGKYDFEAPSEIAYRYFQALRAPKKDFFWFEHSGHWPHLEEPGKFIAMLTQNVLKETYVRFSEDTDEAD
ncbi:MAG TPA: alpha/beta hydrolase [Candidatus Omnitrophota bacterium]|nr:alpha/beta hydrolase [Candidatus Omnitrophota bacterium]